MAAPERLLRRSPPTPIEQDAGDLRPSRTRSPAASVRRPRLPQLHHEAGNPGGVHPGRAGALHAGVQLLPACQDGGGRPWSSTSRRRPRRNCGASSRAHILHADPPQGRRSWSTALPLSRSSPRTRSAARQRAMVVMQRYRARDPVLPRHPRLPARAQAASPGPSWPSPASPSSAARR